MFLLLALARAADPLVVVDDSTFDSVVGSAPVAFVMAWSPTISFSVDLVPKLRAAAEAMQDDCCFALLDFNKSTEVCRRFGIFAVPSIFVFRHGIRTAEYTDERNTNTMLQFLHRITGPSVLELNTSRDVTDCLENQKTVVILAGDEIPSDLIRDFESVASNLTDVITFAWAKTTEAVQALDVEEVPSLQLRRHADRAVVDFPLAFGTDRQGLRKWILENLPPRYFERNAILFRDLGFDRRYTLMAFVDTSKKASLDQVHETLSKVVDQWGQNFTYIYSDVYDVGSLILGLGFTGARDPLYCFVNVQNGGLKEKYLFPEKRNPTPENVMKWVGLFANGSLKPKLRSEPEVTDQQGPLRKIVGTQFANATRHDTTHDVLCLVLAGQNEHDRERALSVINETAIEFAKQKVRGVVFNYIDADANELVGISANDISRTTFFFWTGRQRHLFSIPGNADVLTLMNAILRHSRTRPKFRIPVKYDAASLEL